MKTRLLALIAACAFSATLALAADDKPAAACCSAKDKAACEKSAACAGCTKDKAACPKTGCAKDAAAKKDAPAEKTCPVSGEKLGSMGEPYKYTYKAAGQPDRTVLFCCKMCVKGFEKDPSKYLAKLAAE